MDPVKGEEPAEMPALPVMHAWADMGDSWHLHQQVGDALHEVADAGAVFGGTVVDDHALGHGVDDGDLVAEDGQGLVDAGEFHVDEGLAAFVHAAAGLGLAGLYFEVAGDVGAGDGPLVDALGLLGGPLDHFGVAELVQLAEFQRKPVEVRFNLLQTLSNGGLLLLREVENQIGIINKLASCIQDTRHWGYVQLHIRAMISQRIMQIAAGYEEANDCNELRHSDIRKICSGSDRVLASQPTMSCLENQPRRKELYSMAKVVVDLWFYHEFNDNSTFAGKKARCFQNSFLI